MLKLTVLEVLKTILRFNNKLEGLRKAAMLIITTVYYSERTQIKISKGEKHTG